MWTEKKRLIRSRYNVTSDFRMLKAHRKVTNFLKHFHMYAEKDWVYTNANVTSMWTRLTPQDRDLFNFDVARLDWVLFYNHYMRGIQQYILKEVFDEASYEKAKRDTFR